MREIFSSPKTNLGRKDSNLRVTGPKPAALPLGHAPQRIGMMTISYFEFSVNRPFLVLLPAGKEQQQE